MLASLSLIAVTSMVPCQPPPSGSQAQALWQAGQTALREGQPERAVELFERSLAADPKFTRSYLGLAAAWLDRGDDARACLHLTLYVAAHPQHFAIRAQYAELLQRLSRTNDARQEYERFVADLQADGEAADEYLLHCHSKLMQIAEKQDNDYDEHLHRGIGLWLLARQQCLAAATQNEQSPEALLCRAAAELTLARRVRPEEARPSYYLYAVWTDLAQSQPAARCLREAQVAMPFSSLTASEALHVRLGMQQRERDRMMK